MKKLLFLSAFLAVSIACFAQEELKAQIEYENAEKFFSENRFALALSALDKAEEYLGEWMPTVSYLRIMSCYMAYTQNAMTIVRFTDESKNISLPSDLIREVEKYMAWVGENQDIANIDKFREVYAISEKLTRFVQASSEWNRLQTSESIIELESFASRYSDLPEGKIASNKVNSLKSAELKRQQAAADAALKREATQKWAQIKESNDERELVNFINKYKDAPEVDAARSRLNAIQDMFVIINGVKWAKCNVGEAGKFVSSPEIPGGIYTWDNARKVCPSGWRLPSVLEYRDLIKNEEFKWSNDGFFKSVSGKLIFPISVKGMYFVWQEKAYWSSTEVNKKESRRCFWGTSSWGGTDGVGKKSKEYYVRCVKE